MVFLIVLGTNLVDRQNFFIVGDAIETIYADRLVAQDIIHDLSTSIQWKEFLYTHGTGNTDLTKDTPNFNVQEWENRFAETKLTQSEERVFGHLKEELSRLNKLEKSAMSSENLAHIKESINDIQVFISELSEIQLSQGRRELQRGRKAIGSAHLFTQIEIVALIIMALAVQAIILYDPKVKVDD
ncbi:chemotaxis protein [Lewinellaceae bacterium SD302]|nr:chemotaxis protein [Lewinellaceae bacterium SD302]